MSVVNTVQLVWFRTDLRVHDNSALSAALESVDEKGPVVAIYIATPQQWQEHNDAAIKLDFWKRSLQVLEKSLKDLSVPLYFFEAQTYQDIPSVFDTLCTQWKPTTVLINKEYPLNEKHRDQNVQTLLTSRGIEFLAFDDRLLSSLDEVKTLSGEPFKVFTPFAKKARQLLFVAEKTHPVSPQQSPTMSRIDIALPSIDEINWPVLPESLSVLYPAGEYAALQQLDEFTQNRVQDYKEQRDLPAVHGTSQLSHHLAAGTLSVRQCWITARKFSDGEGLETWCTELLWRDFYSYVVHHYPHVCMHKPWRQDLGHVQWREDKRGFDAWCKGQTGIPLIDAAMRQLLQTGWMHNRLRMVTAMFLSKNLLIDWRLGEQWFMKNLIDGDFAANNGGWQWSASTGTDAAPYFRVFNPVSQSQRFDAKGKFIRQFVPELAHLDDRQIHEPGLLKPENYPSPVVDLKTSRARAIQAFKKIDV